MTRPAARDRAAVVITAIRMIIQRSGPTEASWREAETILRNELADAARQARDDIPPSD